MKYETPEQHELRTMPEAFTAIRGNAKRWQPQATWAAKNAGIDALRAEMGDEAYKAAEEYDRKRMAGGE